MTRVTIRQYTEKDREAISQICADTGFVGKPIDQIFEDRQLFVDISATFYIKKEPEHIFVAIVDRKIVGYIIGWLNPHLERVIGWDIFRTACTMTWKALTGQYKKRSVEYVKWIVFKGIAETPSHPNHAARFHINIRKEYRGLGIGKKLFARYEKLLRKKRIKRYYGNTIDCQQTRDTTGFFRKQGLEVYDFIETSIFKKKLKGKVYRVCFYKNL
jgi:GNAT superfamily N-acetyltransferase